MTDAIAFDGGLTLSVPVANLDRAIGWYRETLGFELLYRLDDMGWCEMSSPVARVNVGLSAVEKPVPGGATPTFGVSDIESARNTLQAKKVRLDGDIQTIEGMVRLQTFYDIDGNTLMLYQDLQAQG